MVFFWINNCLRKAFKNKQKVFRGWKNPDMSGNVGTRRICQLFKFGCKLQSMCEVKGSFTCTYKLVGQKRKVKTGSRIKCLVCVRFCERDRRAVARWVTEECGLKANFSVGKVEVDLAELTLLA